jgi:drug/metabolite transporter (DMT)-like permease
MKIKNYGPLLIAFAAFLWSLDGLLRVSLYSRPPATVVFWEHVLAAFVIAPFMIKRQKEIAQLTKHEWIAILLVSLFSGALGTTLYTAALGKVNYIQFSVVPLLQQLQPIWGIATASILLKEKLNKDFLKWALLAIAASYFVTFKDLTVNFTTGQGTIIAAFFALSAGIVWAVSTSFSKIVLKKTSFWTTTFLRFALAPIFAFMFILVLGQQHTIWTVTTDQWIKLLAITFSTGGVALLIYYIGLKQTPARVSAIAELTWPVSAVIIDYVHFHNALSLTQMLGAIVLIFAMTKVARFQK